MTPRGKLSPPPFRHPPSTSPSVQSSVAAWAQHLGEGIAFKYHCYFRNSQLSHGLRNSQLSLSPHVAQRK